MPTLPVQSAGSAIPALGASNAPSGAPAGDDSFALVLGHAFDGMPEAVQDGSTIAFVPGPHVKPVASDNSDAASSALATFQYVATDLLQPAATLAPSAGGAEAAAIVQSSVAELSSDTQSTVDFGPNTSENPESGNSGTLAISLFKGDSAPPATFWTWTGEEASPTGTNHPQTTEANAPARSQPNRHSRDFMSTTRQSHFESPAAAQPLSAQVWYSGFSESFPIGQSEQPQAGGTLPGADAMQASIPRPKQTFSAPLQLPVSLGLTGSSPQTEPLGPAPMSVRQLSAGSQGLQVGSKPDWLSGPSVQAAPGLEPDARLASQSSSTDGLAESAQYFGRPGTFAGPAWQTPSSLTAYQVGQNQSAMATPASSSPAPPFTANHQSRPELSTRSEVVAKSPAQATSSTMPWADRFLPDDAAVSYVQPATWSPVIDQPGSAELSSVPGEFAGTAPQSTAPLGEQGVQAPPAPAPPASNSPAQHSVTSHRARSEFSKRPEMLADAQATSAPPENPAGLNTPALAPPDSAAPTQSSAADHPHMTQFSSRPEVFAGAPEQTAPNFAPFADQGVPDGHASSSVAIHPARGESLSPPGAVTEVLANSLAQATFNTLPLADRFLPVGPTVARTQAAPTPSSAIDQPEIAELASLRGAFSGTTPEAPAPSALPENQAVQAAPAPAPPASNSPAQRSMTSRRAQSEFSKRPEMFADAQATSAPPENPAGLNTPVLAPPEGAGPTRSSATDQPELANFSRRIAKVGDAQTKASSTPVADQSASDAPAFAAPAGQSPKLSFVTEPPEVAEYSSRPEVLAGTPEQTAPNFAPLADQGVPDGHASSSVAIHPARGESLNPPGAVTEVLANSLAQAIFNTLPLADRFLPDGPTVARTQATPTPSSAIDYPEIAELPSLRGEFSGTAPEVPAPSALPENQVVQAAPAPAPPASNSPAQHSMTSHRAQSEFSKRPEMFADAQATSTAPRNQAGLSAPAFAPSGGAAQTQASATDQPELANFSRRIAKVGDAQTKASSTPVADQSASDGPVFAAPAGQSPTLSFATEPPEVAQFSSRPEVFAGTPEQTPPNPAPLADQAVHESQASSLVAIHPEQGESPSQPGTSTVADTNLSLAGNELQEVTAPENREGTSEAGIPPSADPRNSAPGEAPISAAPKREKVRNIVADGVVARDQSGFDRMATDVAGQNGVEPDTTNTQTPLSFPAGQIQPQPIYGNSTSAIATTVSQKVAVLPADGMQTSDPASASSEGSPAPAALSESSTSGQGKPWQQNGQTSGDGQTSVRMPIPTPVVNAAPDSTATVLTAHALNIPASRTDLSTLQATPTSHQPSTTLSAWQSYEGGPGKIVQSASLSDTAKGAEMHVEMRGGTLGPLEVHAVLNEGSLGAEIHVQGQEAHTLLAAGLPSLERTLGERNLHVENLAVYQDQAGGGMSGGERQDQQSGSYPSGQHQVTRWDNPPQPLGAASGSSEGDELAIPATGLSVRA